MKLAPLTLLIGCAISSPRLLSGQSPNPDFNNPSYNSTLTIKTDGAHYKGRLVGLTDTSLYLVRLKEKDRIEIPAREIESIKVKRRFFRSVLVDFCMGAAVPTVLLLAFHPEDPDWFYGQLLLKTLIVGSGVGIVGGIMESAFFRQRILINKNVYIFQQRRSRLSKYWTNK